MDSDLATALGGLGATCIGLATMTLKRYMAEKEQREAVEAIIGHANTVDVLNDLAAKMKASKVMLCYTENGGGIPSIGKPLYVTVLHEVLGVAGLQPVRLDMQRVLADGGLVVLLCRMIEQTRWRGKASELEPGIFRTLLEENKIGYVDCFGVAKVQKAYYFCVVAWGDGEPVPTHEQRDLMASSATPKLRRLLEK